MDAVTEPSPAPYDPCGGGNLRREARHADGADMPPVRHSDPERDPGRLRALRVDRGSPTLSDEALALVDGERQGAYGPPVESLTNIGSAWAGVLNLPEPIPAWRVALCLAAMKLVRAGQRGDEDSVRDAFGYLHLTERLRP